MIKQIITDDKPFTEAKTYLADAKFYFQKETKRKESVREKIQYFKVSISRYIPKSKRKESQSSFIKSDTLNILLTKLELVKNEKMNMQEFVQ